jgi:hypothetical protein
MKRALLIFLLLVLLVINFWILDDSFNFVSFPKFPWQHQKSLPTGLFQCIFNNSCLNGLNYGSDKTESVNQTENETSGWQVYENEDYGFEFKYPSNWNLADDSGKPGVETYVELMPPEEASDGFLYRFLVTIESKSLEESKNFSNTAGVKMKSEEEINIAGKNSIKQTLTQNGRDALPEIIYYIAISKEKTLLISIDSLDAGGAHREYNETLNQILSTFKFTN